jgi:23S rRNA pseudouridine1911/1915/1917 synthase
MGSISLVVAADAGGGTRLDRYCAMKDGSVSRSRLKNGAVDIRVNGIVSKMSRMVRENDVITVEWTDPPSVLPSAENIPLEIIYEDEFVTVVNKRQGMVTHPGAGNWSGTLVHALLWHWKELAPDGNLRPGIVHRLDKDTSGGIITARKPEAESWLQKQFSERKTRKIYYAILCGRPVPDRGEIKTNIVRDPKNRKRFTWSEDPEKGRFAHTSYKVVSSYGTYAIVRFSIHTGRTHQIRVHSKYLGCPILGDPIYGKKDPLFPGATLMLHARSLTVVLPPTEAPVATDGTAVTFTAPIPLRFRKVLATLRERFPK